MNWYKLAVMLFLLFMLSGCSSNPAPLTSQPGPTQTRPQPSPAPTLTPRVLIKETDAVEFPQNIIELTTVPFDRTSVNGFQILSKSGDSAPYTIYDIKNDKIVDKMDFYEVSPNKKYMLTGACAGDSPTDKCNYILRTANKIIKTDLPTGDDWAPARWLDNERVVFLHRLKRNQAVQPQDVVILNPFSGEKSSLRLELPNPYTFDKSGGPDNLIEASLAASLKRVFFIDQNYSLVLWDLESQKEMASLSQADSISQFGSAGWSPDGKKFVATSPNKFQYSSSDGYIPSANELFMFDVDGNLTQLTHYNRQYPFANVAGQVWSPDNRHIAFWLSIGKNAATASVGSLHPWLAIFDTSTLATGIYRSGLSGSTFLPTLVWSPDGQELIVSGVDSNLTLVDLAHQTRSQIPGTQDMRVEDWMAP